MTVIPHTDAEAFSIDALHPKMRVPIRAMISATNAYRWTWKGLPCRFEPFEGYRTPIRQSYLLTVRKTTKAGPWESAHQYGLAVDFAVRVNYDSLRQHWSWPDSAPWTELRKMAKNCGLDIPIKWDLGHVENPLWASFEKLMRR